MATVTADRIQIDGTAPTYNTASAGGDKAPTGDDTVLHVVNNSAGEITCTLTTPGQIIGQDISDVAVAVPAGAERFIGPLPRQHLAGDNGLVDIAWSAATSVTFAVIRL